MHARLLSVGQLNRGSDGSTHRGASIGRRPRGTRIACRKRSMDAIELLKKDHQEVTKLFQRFSGAKGRRNDTSVVEKICAELDVHARIEEEIFYPAVREASSELARKVDESLQEHARVKEQVHALREQLRGGAEGDGALEGQVSALEQDVEHHVTEEEGEMFPQVAEKMDGRQRTRLGERLKARKA